MVIRGSGLLGKHGFESGQLLEDLLPADILLSLPGHAEDDCLCAFVERYLLPVVPDEAKVERHPHDNPIRVRPEMEAALRPRLETLSVEVGDDEARDFCLAFLAAWKPAVAIRYHVVPNGVAILAVDEGGLVRRRLDAGNSSAHGHPFLDPSDPNALDDEARRKLASSLAIDLADDLDVPYGMIVHDTEAEARARDDYDALRRAFGR